MDLLLAGARHILGDDLLCTICHLGWSLQRAIDFAECAWDAINMVKDDEHSRLGCLKGKRLNIVTKNPAIGLGVSFS